MQKPKLTQAQVDALKKAVSHYGDTEKLIRHHEGLKRVGEEWTTWPELNDLSAEDLKRAIVHGFETVEDWTPDNLLKYGEDFAKEMYNWLEDDMSYENRYATLKNHARKLQSKHGWTYLKTFNRLSLHEMADALGIDYKGADLLFQNAGGGEVKPIRVRKVKPDYSERIQALQLDLDYWLASLFDAIQRKAEAEIVECKWQCKEIQEELKQFDSELPGF